MKASNFVAAVASTQGAEYFVEGSKPTADEHSSRFVLWRVLAGLFLSVILVVPCLWHRWLVAGDLGSHVYNAWLTQMVERGGLPGVRLADQWNNVLFDFLLTGLGRLFSFPLAYRIAAAFSVLLFFWSAFAFVKAVTSQTPWFLAPMIAVIGYGWTFQEGIFNYYLSLGVAFLALSIWLRGKGWNRFLAFALTPIIFLAHPIGLAWALGAGLYAVIAEATPRRFHPVLVLAAIGCLYLAGAFLRSHYSTAGAAHSTLSYSGLDQFVFTSRYELLPLILCAILLAAVARETVVLRSASDLWARCSMPVQLYLIVEAAIQFLPDSVRLPQYAAPVASLTARLTLISAVLLCCMLGTLRFRVWHRLALGIVAALFFAFLYQDTGTLSDMQERVSALVHSLPPGQRVLSTIVPPLRYRLSPKHILDLACVGYCFDYGNYEPATRQFRVRALPGNRFVISDEQDASAAEAGAYVVQTRDVPVYQLYQCRSAWSDLCIRPLQAGEINGRGGMHFEP